MDPLALTTGALREPWRLWTCHLVHFGWEHALLNTITLTVPLLLAPPKDRRRLLATLLIVAPLLSLLLLPGLAEGQYRGASGLVCVVWAWAGLRLVTRGEARTMGVAMLGALAGKLAMEAAFGSPFLPAHADWQALPSAHAWGALLGLVAALPGVPLLQAAPPHRAGGALELH